MASRLKDATDAMEAAEEKAAELRDMLILLSMALGFEPGGLGAREKSAIETVVGLARDTQVKSMEAIADAYRLVMQVAG